MTPVIRAATHNDLSQLHRLVEGAYRGDSARRGWTHEADLLGGQRTDLDALREIVDDPAQCILLAICNGRIVGCVQITDKGEGLSCLGLLSVDPAMQAAGLGRTLIAAAEQEAMARFGARMMEMTVIRQRAELIAYYTRRGYLPTGEERPFPIGNPRFGLPKTRELAFVVLAKPLLPAPLS